MNSGTYKAYAEERKKFKEELKTKQGKKIPPHIRISPSNVVPGKPGKEEIKE